jgi:hypothetical protein
MFAYIKENRGAVFFNLSLVGLVIISLLASRFPSFSIWFVLGAATLAVLAPLIAARLEAVNSSVALKEGVSASSTENVEAPIVNPASDDGVKLSHSIIYKATKEALLGQVHPDAYSRLIEDLARHVSPSAGAEMGSAKEKFAVTLNIINVYISGTAKGAGSEVSGKREFILQPELASELYGKHGAVH